MFFAQSQIRCATVSVKTIPNLSLTGTHSGQCFSTPYKYVNSVDN